jgi:hypothetical protein
MQLCRIIYYSLDAVRVLSDIFAHHQEHLNCITASGITHVCRCRLVSRECWNAVHTWTHGYMDIWTRGHIDTWTYGHRDIWIYGHTDMWTYANRRQWMSLKRIKLL